MKSKAEKKQSSSVRGFIRNHYRHFNAAVVRDAAQAWVEHLRCGGKMFLAMGGAMSTAEIGLSLAGMIRRGKIHGISTTGANLEEDVFNLVAHRHYKRLPNYRTLTPVQEEALRRRGLNRVTDTCIPEEHAMRRIEKKFVAAWQKAARQGRRLFHYEFVYQLLDDDALKGLYEIDPRDSWVVAAWEKRIPIWTPGWEDSSLGNFFVAGLRKGTVPSADIVKSGPEQMSFLIDWYVETTKRHSLGFFQIGGGIAGDFAICVVPLISQDLKKFCRFWGYFAQISDSTTSYGSYSGAVPNEKITWGKLGTTTPRFIIESDATIVAPLIFQYVLES